MKRSLALLTIAVATMANAQTAPKPVHPASPSTKAAKTTTARSAAAAATYKVPADEKRIPGLPKTALALRYQDIKIGTGAEGESGKLWRVKYKGWRAADGVVFDAWDKHPQPSMGADGKPEMGPDGKPKMKDPEPMPFPQGMGRMIPGFDYGVAGMHVGGKRRLFIPWQMAYGNRAIPDRDPEHPGIPAKSDLIFDVELVDTADLPQPPQRPMGMPPGARPSGSGAPPAPATPPSGSNPGATANPAPATPPPASQPK